MKAARQNKYARLERLDKYPGYWVNPVSGIIYYRATIKGKRIKVSTGTTSIKAAKLFIEEYLEQKYSANPKKAKRQRLGIQNPTIKELWDELVAERRPSRAPSTIKTYEVSWKIKLSPFWGESRASDVTERSVIEFQNWYLDTFPGQGFFNAGKHLQMLFRYMAREGHLKEMPVLADLDKIIAGKSKKDKKFRVYTEAEQKSLVENAVNERAKLIIVAYLDTGMRKMELLSRKTADLDLKSKTINVWSTKNKKWRTLPLTARLHALLKAWAATNRGEYLFPKARSKGHISGQYFDKEWVATKKAAGITGKATVHYLRHTFATKTAQDSWPLMVACKALDMSAREYQKTYVHINETDISKLMFKSFGKG